MISGDEKPLCVEMFDNARGGFREKSKPQRCTFGERSPDVKSCNTKSRYYRPNLKDVYLDGINRVMVTDLDAGVPLHKIWKKLGRFNKKFLIQQLRDELLIMRQSTQPMIGRVGWDGNTKKDDPYYDPYHPDVLSQTITTFASEAESDVH